MSLFFTAAVIIAVIATSCSFPLLYNNVFLKIPGVAKYTPGDILNRYVLLVVMITIWWSYARLGLRTIQLGRPTARKLKTAFFAGLIGLTLICIYFLIKMLMGQGKFDVNALVHMGLLKTLLWYLLGAITVGLLEEVLFRGIALQIFMEDFKTARFAVLLSSLLFAAVHFIDFAEIADIALGTNNVNGSIFSLTSAAKFTLLAVTGILLACARKYTNTLYAAIGLHAGFVVALRTFSKIYKANPGYSSSIFFLSGIDLFLMTGILTLAFILIRWLPDQDGTR